MSASAPANKAIVEPTIRSDVVVESNADMRMWCRDVARSFDRMPLEAAFTFSGTGPLKRCTIQVTDRLARGTNGPEIVLIWISDSASGTITTGQSVTFPTGTVLVTYVVNAKWLVMTNVKGIIEMDITVSGSGTRHVYAVVMPPPQIGTSQWQ